MTLGQHSFIVSTTLKRLHKVITLPLHPFSPDTYIKSTAINVCKLETEVHHEVGSLKSEVGSQKSEVRSRKSEVGSPKSEVGSRKSEVGSRKSEV